MNHTITLAEFQVLCGLSDCSMMTLLRAAILPLEFDAKTNELRVGVDKLPWASMHAALSSIPATTQNSEGLFRLEIERVLLDYIDNLVAELKPN